MKLCSRKDFVRHLFIGTICGARPQAPFLCVVPRTVIENVYNFYDFYKALMLQSLRKGNFFELADNEVLGCSRVVGADSRKWGHFRVIRGRLVRFRSAGGTGPKGSDTPVAFTINRVDGE